jgi:glucosamine--fructose-6-phosphate aminotransferase (isomerizing)
MTHLTPDSNVYLRDILDQPAAVHDTLAGMTDLVAVRSYAARLASGEMRRVVLTGMGASYYSLHSLNLTLIERGLTSLMMETSELVHYAPALFDERTLIVAISQSGQSAEVKQLLNRVSGRAPLLAVTNETDNPLALHADSAVITRAGAENSVSCKTYVAALAALAVLGDGLTGLDMNPTLSALSDAPRLMGQYLGRWQAHVEDLMSILANTRHLILAGRGTSQAAANTGSLIIQEAAHFPAEGMSAAAFRHGPLEMVSPELFILVYAGDQRTEALNAKLVTDVQSMGGRAALVTDSTSAAAFSLPTCPALLRPLLEILPAQMMSLALAQLHGHEAGCFERTAKVTISE